MNYILSLVLTISFVSINFSSLKDNASDKCKTAIEAAERDYAKNTLKYYTFGIASFPKQEIKLDIGPKVEVVSLGCMINTHQICYNQYVDSLLIAKTGFDFYGLAQ